MYLCHSVFFCSQASQQNSPGGIHTLKGLLGILGITVVCVFWEVLIVLQTLLPSYSRQMKAQGSRRGAGLHLLHPAVGCDVQ